ncbi:MAG: protein-disulfide reductase DsbD family protein, partial [Rickettsiaceae bacterium]|nr:protein-disulfide reductase DsbD family protein [Rickettsiaceae bacterium]
MNFQVLRKTLIIIILSLPLFSIADDQIFIANQNNQISLNLDLDGDSKIYWFRQTKHGLPSEIALENPENICSHQIQWPWPLIQKEYGKNTAIYTKSLSIPIVIKKIDQDKPAKATLIMTYVECNSLGCFPKKHELVLEIPGNTDEVSQNRAPKEDLIQKVQFSENNLQVVVSDKESKIFALYNQEIYLPAKNISQKDLKISVFEGLRDKKGKVEFFLSKTNYIKELELENIETLTASSNFLIYYLAISLLGGFILNFMPCVLPVLSLKLFNLVNAKTPSQRRGDAAISIATIIIYFASLGVFASLAKMSGEFFSAGLSLQMPSVIILCIVFVLITLGISLDRINLNLQIPFLLNYSGSSNSLNVIASSLVSTILATPCTAPFLATSVTFALSQNIPVIIMIFATSGIGFASPYILVSFWPGIIDLLPRSGKWQKYLKYFFILLLILTIFWLFWILQAQIGILSAFSVLILAYGIRFAIESSIKRKAMILLCLLGGILNIPFWIGSNQTNLTLHHGSRDWEEFSAQKLSDYKEKGEIIFIFATAEWCATCKL